MKQKLFGKLAAAALAAVMALTAAPAVYAEYEELPVTPEDSVIPSSQHRVINITDLSPEELEYYRERSLYYDDIAVVEPPESDLFPELPPEPERDNVSSIVNNVASNKWVAEYDRTGNCIFSVDTSTTYNGSPYSLKIENADYSMGIFTQTFAVSPDTTYRFSAMVKYSGLVISSDAENQNTGASIGTYWSYSLTDRVEDSEWRKVEYTFTTKNDETERKLALNNGLWDALCKGTAWFTDIKIEKAEFSNNWDILAIVFKNVDADVTRDGVRTVYKDSFTSDDIKYQKAVLDDLKVSLNKFSGGLMNVRCIDLVTTEATVTEFSIYDYIDKYEEVHGWQPDMLHKTITDEIDKALEASDKNYDQILVSMPAYGLVGWAGLSNSDYRGINLCKQVFLSGKTTADITNQTLPSSVWIHEMMHNLESDSYYLTREYINSVHTSTDYGFSGDGEEWFTAFMQNKIPNGGKGVVPQAYQKIESYKTIFSDMSATGTTVIPEYTVTFSGATVSAQTIKSGGVPTEPAVPTKSGYRFGGWFADAAYTKLYDFYAPIYSNTTVYAQFTQIQSGDADFEINEGIMTAYKGNGGSITIPSDVRMISGTFLSSADKVTTINVAGENKFYTSINGVLFTKDRKTLISYPKAKPDTSYTIPAGTIEIKNNAFDPNSVTKVLTLNEGLEVLGGYSVPYKKIMNFPSTLKTIGAQALCGITTPDNTVTLPESVIKLGAYVFIWTKKLTSVTISCNITDLPFRTFDGCTDMKRVVLPASLLRIGKDAFNDCTSLTDIFFMGTQAQWDAIDKTKAAIPAKCTVHCEGGGSSEPVPASGNIIATFGGSDHAFADLTTLGKDKAFKAATGTVTITVNADFTTAQTFAFPSKATAITFKGDKAHKVTLKAATLTSKGSLTVENLELVSGKKNTGLTAKTTLTVKNSTVGALKAAATTLVTSNVYGKIAASGELTITGTQCYEDVSMTAKTANITLSNSTAYKKVTSSGGVILTNGSYILGALKATGILTLNVGTHVMSTVTAGGIEIAA